MTRLRRRDVPPSPPGAEPPRRGRRRRRQGRVAAAFPKRTTTALPDDHASEVIDLITGRWRSQVLHAGTALGVFDALDGAEPATAEALAGRLGAAPGTLYRLMRALASIGLLAEAPEGCFRPTPRGVLLRRDHPASLRGMALLEEGPVHYAVWKHLPEIVRSGRDDGFKREYGEGYFSHMRRDPSYARAFAEAMSSYSAGEAPAAREALRGEDFDGKVVCDVGGSAGALLAEVPRDHAAARAIVFDLPEVVAETGRADRAAGPRLEFIGGDMFDAVPAADVYLLKHILHDWSDHDCARILSVAHRSARPGARLMICEMIVPGPEAPHIAKLIDIHMMVVQSGRQRTVAEMGALLGGSGWTLRSCRPLSGSPLSLLEAGMAPGPGST